MVVDVKELCRLCGKKEEYHKDLKDEDNKSIIKMIQEFIQIPFTEHDELPTKVCLNCEETVESFQLFVLECYNVQDILRQMYLQTCKIHLVKLEDDVVIDDDFNNSAIKSEVEHELSAEDLVNANNSDACMTGVDADDCNNDNDDDDSVTLATLKDLRQEKTSETRRMTSTETGMEHLKEISDLNTGDLIECDERPRITKTLSASAMKKHKKRHKPKKRNGGARKFCCSSCDKVFTIRSELIRHVQHHLPIEERKTYSCGLCEVKFTERRSVARHRRVAHDKIKPHVCDVCGRAFPSAAELRRHRAVHSDDRPFACRECDKRFKTRAYLRSHEETHDDKHRYVCAHCDKAFKRRKVLKEHMYTHTGDKPLACEWCDVRCMYPYSLRTHQLSHHPDKMARFHNKFKCDVCGLACANASHLRQHHVVHSDDRPFACRTCDKRFKRRADLKKHEVTHDDKRRYVCAHCDMAFKRQQTLKRHIMRKHTSREPLLRGHQLSRHADKMAPASPRQRFKRRAHLTGHQLTHDDKRRYVCAHCDKVFKHRQLIKEHIRLHTGDKPLACEWCDFHCSRASLLCYHRRRHHPDKMARTSPRQRDTKDDEDPPKTDVEAI